ncbi:serine hydrolase domain-containing protein [Caulobacter sp. KR2-114]|uniref:serine hydrolase domain-containing protein n=1 Tax=Caulobacter sp. KR2-114 TaxID=3400912 RepID=UPI003BFD9BE9
MPTVLPALPTQPADTPWPTEAWPTGPLPPGADAARIHAMLGHAFQAEPPADLGETQAVVVIHRGRLVTERYGPRHGPEATTWSWSMAKSITHALVGLAVKDGVLDVHAPAPVPEWRAAGDPRAAITLDLLLRMSSGLAFREEYKPEHPSDVIEMLWGRGKDDTAAFAAGFPLAHPPGSHFYYSSGTTNIVSRCLADALGRHGGEFQAFMEERLFDPLGITSATPKFDAAGTFIGSSFCFCTPRDFARFGLLYLRDGVWEGRRLLPEGWVDYARTATFQQPDCPDGPYGAHWWLDLAGPGSFSANGHDGQFIICCPDRDLIVVRNGVTPSEQGPVLKAWLRDLAAAFAAEG